MKLLAFYEEIYNRLSKCVQRVNAHTIVVVQI